MYCSLNFAGAAVSVHGFIHLLCSKHAALCCKGLVKKKKKKRKDFFFHSTENYDMLNFNNFIPVQLVCMKTCVCVVGLERQLA